MSRVDELKKQYPELNISLFDMFSKIDTTKTYKYYPLLCKIFGKRFSTDFQYDNDKSRINEAVTEISENLKEKGISVQGMSNNEIYYMQHLTDNYANESFYTIKEFIKYMDNNQIENKDVTSYSTLDQMRNAVSVASMKELHKELEGQVIKEHEDDTWLVVRPLTFKSSIKYGASTRWCTTYQKDKHYFEKYWRGGILVYFINKVTGYKFAGYRELHGDKELSFWNAEDTRVDYLAVDADDYLYPIVKRIFKSTDTNKNLCSDEIQKQVHGECLENPSKKMTLVARMDDLVDRIDDGVQQTEYENEPDIELESETFHLGNQLLSHEEINDLLSENTIYRNPHN